MHEELLKLKLKKATLLEQMSMLSSISDKFYLQLGKLEADIITLERKIIQQTKNTLD